MASSTINQIARRGCPKRIILLTNCQKISNCLVAKQRKRSVCSYSIAKGIFLRAASCSERRVPLRKRSFWTSGVLGDTPNVSMNKNEEERKKYTHFGYDRVLENEKVEKVYGVFENVANSYDLMNDLMSAGTHRLWKQHFVNQLNLKPDMKILDMAGGTGDIAFKMLDNLVSVTSSSALDAPLTKTEITVSDINKNMLDVGQKRAAKLGIENEFSWIEADAENLPFDDDTFDLYTIAFGIRNTTHIDKVLEEAYRVLKFGGRLSCLEFSHVQNPMINGLYDMYSFQMIPVLGQIFASDWDSYQYLVESIRQFPKQEDFADMIYDAGFSNVMYDNLTFGVVAIHDGFKI